MTEATHPTTRPRRRWWLLVAVVVVLLVVAVVVASMIDLPYYALSPGDATPVAPRIAVPSGRGHHIRGAVLLTDVLLSQVTLLDYLPDRWSAGTSVVPADEVLGPATPPSQLEAQGFLEMAQSQAAAKAAALNRLGYSVGTRNAGVLIFAVQPGSPAAGALRVGEIVTAVGTTPTPDACALVTALHGESPGDDVTLLVERSSVTSNAILQPGKVVQESVRLGKAPSATGSSGCPGVSGPTRAYLGVEIETWQDFTYPFSVKIDTSNIGGPSAGLAMTLGIIDSLEGGDLTGGAVVAATGTIDPSGAVGDVGGVAQKTVAVERAGAKAFLVPPQEYGVAKSAAGGGLQVYAVSSLDQALGVLRRLGGHIPPAAAPTAAATPVPAAGASG